MVDTGRERDRLATEAKLLQQAWIVSMAWIGRRPAADDLVIPKYEVWPKRQLREQATTLREEFATCANYFVKVESRDELLGLARWMRPIFDRLAAATGPFKICMAIEFEREFGPLKHRFSAEVPPYAELLMQGFHGVAIRHPEYMLARDLEFLHSLFLRSEELVAAQNWAAPPEWARRASENVQALARATIQACFSLIESFISGIAQAFLMTHPDADAGLRDRLLDNNRPLKSRVTQTPTLVSGRPVDLDVNKSPMKELFGHIKERRDSFVHCEPGETPAKWGYVKEERFHDVSPQIVSEAVNLTTTLITTIWSHVHGVETGPRWLPDLSNGESRRDRNLVLVPPTEASKAGRV